MEGGEHILLLKKVLVMLGTRVYRRKKFKNVHGQLRFVLVCVVEGKGLNELIEKKRGKLPNDEKGSYGSVEMHGIYTASLQAEYV